MSMAMDTMHDNRTAQFLGALLGDHDPDMAGQSDHDSATPPPAASTRADDALVEYTPRRPVFCSR
jgi:hypothetical protein